MLIAFKLQNFRSFLGEQTFTFASSGDRTHESHCLHTGMKAVPRISKSAIVFGANASGKTNLLIALATLRDLMLHSTGYSEGRLSGWYTPFRFGPSGRQPTHFEIDLFLDGVRYQYAVAYDAIRITWERLLVYRTGKSQRWFERRFDAATQTEEWGAFSPSFNGPREMWRKATRTHALFLTAAVQLNSEQLAPLLHWIEHGLQIVFPSGRGDLGRIAGYIKNDAFKGRLLRLLRAVDIAVDDVRLVDPEPDAGTRLEFLYDRVGWQPVWMDSVFEAAGTHRLFALFAPLLTAIEQGRLLVVDEFDMGLHPLIARFLVQLINDPAVSDRGAQLLLVSHNTTLMDLDILRRDEIWLMQLDAHRASTLAPLVHAAPRNRESIAKCYLKGNYGAVPRIQTELHDIASPRRA